MIEPITYETHHSLPFRWVVLASTVGLTMVGGSYLIAALLRHDWLADLLLSLGTALMLVVPLYFLTRSLDAHIERSATLQVEKLLDKLEKTVEIEMEAYERANRMPPIKKDDSAP